MAPWPNQWQQWSPNDGMMQQQRLVSGVHNNNNKYDRQQQQQKKVKYKANRRVESVLKTANNG